ncbi:MAG: hypothetical protein WD757_07350 [Actinomycetota bacterium]
MKKRPGLSDPDDWIGWWLQLHPSDLFYGEVARLALRCISDKQFQEGPGVETLSFVEGDQSFEAEVTYLLEQFPAGRILHVLPGTSATAWWSSSRKTRRMASTR